jgi:glycine/D-amino acid oxidase-like deaminating enzyme
LPDAIVIGAGICGASAAHFLAERGVDVLVLDRAGVCGGTTGLGEGNVLVSDKRPGVERDLTVSGRQLWNELGARYAAARVTRKGALLLGYPGGVAAGELEPAVAEGTLALHDPDDLQVDPVGLTRALLEPLAVRADAEVVSAGRGFVELAGGERIACEHVVVAAGPWSSELTGLPVEPRKGQLVALRADGLELRHKLIEAAYIDAVESPDEGLMVASVIEQTLTGDEILVGSSRERSGFDPHVDPEITRVMLERATAFVPELARLEVLRAWCGFRPWLPDGLPAVGPLADGVWVSTGHEGSGIALGPVSGLMLAQMITGETPAADPEPFDPRRFALRPGRAL